MPFRPNFIAVGGEDCAENFHAMQQHNSTQSQLSIINNDGVDVYVLLALHETRSREFVEFELHAPKALLDGRGEAPQGSLKHIYTENFHPLLFHGKLKKRGQLPTPTIFTDVDLLLADCEGDFKINMQQGKAEIYEQLSRLALYYYQMVDVSRWVSLLQVEIHQNILRMTGRVTQNLVPAGILDKRPTQE